MSQRLPSVDPSVAQGRAKELLDGVKAKFGKVPNALKVMAQSPALLEGYLGLSGALSHGVLSGAVREQIALVVSENNGCEYCLSAHSFFGKLAGLKPDDIAAARQGRAQDLKSQAILNLTTNILEHHGDVSDEQLEEAKTAGLTDAEIAEVVGNVAVMTLTNYLNELAHTEVDFPKVPVTA